MKLSLEQIRSIAKGCARITSENGKTRLLRFTEEQEAAYCKRKESFYKKTVASAGVRLEFVTNSRTLGLTVDVAQSSTRSRFCHDIFVNGEKKFELRSSFDPESPSSMVLNGSYALGDGKKKICIYFPFSACSEIIALELENGATLAPVEHSRTILMLGDSITHGYDCASPSESYSSKLTDALDAQGCNKGIGGEIFFPDLATLRDSYTPDIITVAYGTNDWSTTNLEKFNTNCELFYKNLSALYPDSKIFALTPIWRKSYQENRGVGDFFHIRDKIFEIARELPNVTPIDCFDFVPHDLAMFSDGLHPNSLGFSHYAQNLIRAIAAHLDTK